MAAEKIAEKKKMPSMETVITPYEIKKAEELFTEFLDKCTSPKVSRLGESSWIMVAINDAWREICNNVDSALTVSEVNKLFLAHLKNSIEASKKDSTPSNAKILSIVEKLSATKTYSDLGRFRREDHAEVRAAMADAIEYNIEHAANDKQRADNERKAREILRGEFGMPTYEFVEVNKTVGRIFKHTEPVKESRLIKLSSELEKFKAGKF